jgi:putative tryptophan/tyrosine transport system substrate-binding protein
VLFDQLRRREFITLLGVGTAWPLEVLAQEPGRTYRLGGLSPSPRDAPHYAALFAELRRFGFIEGQNLTVDWRGYGVRTDQFPDIAVELVKAKIDVIFCGGDAAVRAAQQATATVPILGVTDDMVGAGLVRSLAQPGGNTTGVSILATELDGKRQDILIEAVPGIRRMATLADTNTTTPQHLQALRDAARARGVELLIHRVAKSEEVAPAIDAARNSDVAALNVLASALLFANRRVIIDRAAALHLPTVFQWAEMAEEGGLITYGPRLIQMFRDLGGRQLIKLFRGAKPTDLPVEQPTHFELVINLKTAKAIGHEVPAGLVLRADKVIE